MVNWPARRWVAPLFGLAAVLLVPWVVALVLLLPSAHKSAHWDIAWSGFDVVLAVVLSAVALAAWRGSLWFEGAATAAATLLFVDAWFDVLTSSTRVEFLVAIGEAVFIELPLAFLCLLLARDAERRLRASGGWVELARTDWNRESIRRRGERTGPFRVVGAGRVVGEVEVEDELAAFLTEVGSLDRVEQVAPGAVGLGRARRIAER
jgi:hypothetical protein